ncbi:MFS general substrate transporter-4 [Coleophoma crateriformis]|uniref:MFS general substrate transporter-4 n=1 Tax=Coleophoma crateriformis TaxID=565419 RepID=A0A3D8QBJ1_9HELO|nr:MFS general substrate transporter-4 [Coleophoma crateriformis]
MSTQNDKKTSTVDLEITHEPSVSLEHGEPIDEKVVDAAVDDAYLFVMQHGVGVLTEEQNRKLRRKIDNILMPLLIITYTLSFMDKQAMAYSANYGLDTDEHMNSSQYSWASGSILYLSVLVCQFPIGRVIQVVPIGRFLSTTVIIWGMILMCTAATRSFAALAVVRALLGAAEAGIAPCLLIYTAQWYTRAEQPERTGYWFIANALGQIFGGLIGYGIGHIHSTLGVGNWIFYFIIFGAVTILWGIFLLFTLPDTPMGARWLSLEERAMAIERVRENKTGIINHVWKWNQFRECIIDPKTFLLFATLVCNAIPSGGVASFGNIVIKGFGFSALNTTLLQMPLGVIQAISILISGALTSRFKNIRCHVMSLSQVPALIGAILLVVLPESNKNGRLGAYYVIQTHTVSYVMAYSLITGNYAGFTKKSTVAAIVFIASSAGQVAGPQLFIGSEAPKYPTAFAAAIACFVILIVLPYVIQGYLMWDNHRRDKKAATEPEESEETQAEQGFMDLTDWQQKSFRYVY